MALPVLMRCSGCRLSFVWGRHRLIGTENLAGRGAHTPGPQPQPLACSLRPAWARPYSSGEKKQKVVVVGVPNILNWCRLRVYFFLIRAYFDKDFNLDEFKEGATQAFSHVSKLLSKCQFEALEGLVAKDLMGKLEEKCKLLSNSHREALSAEPDEIMYATPGDVGIYYDNNGRKFVCILMCFWYLTSSQLPEGAVDSERIFRLVIREQKGADTKRLLTANYEFQREFTKGVAPNWTIMRIEHSRLLD